MAVQIVEGDQAHGDAFIRMQRAGAQQRDSGEQRPCQGAAEVPAQVVQSASIHFASVPVLLRWRSLRPLSAQHAFAKFGAMDAARVADANRRDAEVIGLIGLAHGTSHFFHLMLPPLFPWLMADFSLSFTQAGFLMTLFFVASGIGQALAGFVVDRIGARPVLLFGVATLGVSALLLSAAVSYGGLVVAAVVAGIGNSIFHPADFTLLNRRVSSARLGHAFSVHGLTGNLGWAAGSVVMAGVAAASSWRTAAIVAALIGFAVLSLLLARRRSLADAAPAVAAPARAGAAQALPGAFAFLRSGAVWLCFAFFLITTAAFGVLQNYAPAILNAVYALSLPVASLGLTAYLLGSAAGMVLGGFFGGRFEDSDFVIAPALTVSALTAMLLASGMAPSVAVLPLMALIGLGVGVAGPSRDLLVRRAATAQFGATAYGRVYGFVYSGLDIGLASAPLLFGPMLDAGRYAAPLLGVAILQVAALLLAVVVGSGTRRLRQVRSEMQT
jgi:MFS family permease